jgi:protein translocase SecG subunit
MALYIVACFVLILFVLLQPGKSDAAAVFGGGANTAAFGPRGTATVLAKITITAAIIFFLIAFLFSIPGIFEKRSIGEGVNAPAEQAPAPAPLPAPEQQPAAVPPVTTPAPTVNSNTSSPAKPAATAQPAGANKGAATANANRK